MTSGQKQGAERMTVSIARQPIFDEKRRLWGYILCCIGAGVGCMSNKPEADDVAVNMAASAQMELQQIIERDKKVMIHFSERNILDQLPYALPPALTVVQVTETIFQKPSVPQALNQLKADGYPLAISDFSASSKCDSFYRLADIIGLDVGQKSKEELKSALAKIQPYKADKMALGVMDPARFALCRELGFNLFQGAFFKTPETITIRKFSSSEASRFNLMHTIQQQEVDYEQLAETIQADASLSFRLLSHLNSAAFGMRQKIKSIHQAITLLGWRKMKNWLRVVLLNDVNQSQDAPELMLLAAQRGKFLERIGQIYDYWGFDPESLHMLGIFSLLDAMLGMPMRHIVTYLPLDEKLKAALCREPNNEYLPLLQLAQLCEEA
ncbi:MAG: HDOD domain-containing protein, partial [Desulfatitalea sp.]|nr:HDOD domain-containing protein [Desulfatitalea sp.]